MQHTSNTSSSSERKTEYHLNTFSNERFNKTVQIASKQICYSSRIMDGGLCSGIFNPARNWPYFKVKIVHLSWTIHSHISSREIGFLMTETKGTCQVRSATDTIRSVKCYPGGWKIDHIPSISEIRSQTWYHCIQYTRHHHMSLVSHC